MANPMQLMCALAVRGPFDAVIVPRFEAAGGAISIAWNPTSVIMKQIAAGQRADALLVMSDSMDDLVARGIVDPGTRVDVVQSGLGVAVAAGAPHPAAVFTGAPQYDAACRFIEALGSEQAIAAYRQSGLDPIKH